MLRLWLHCLNLVLIVSVAYSQNHYTFKKEGETCFMPDGVQGICRRRSVCNRPWGFKRLQFDLEAYQPCGFTETDERLYCCYATVDRAKRACDEYRTWTRDNPGKGSLISNGKVARLGDFPHMVGLWYNDSDSGKRTKWQCGGSLISEWFALTAAHCLTQSRSKIIPPTRLRVGDLDLNTEQDIDKDTVTYDISQHIIHPLYNNKRSTYNDIGLVKTAKKVHFSMTVHPACLYLEPVPPASELKISGYGVNQSLGSSFQGILIYAVVRAVDSNTCNASYRHYINLPNGIVDTQICALSDKNAEGRYSDTCEGDSGGPLQYQEDDLFFIVGVTSGGRHCTAQGIEQPGIYTRVSKFAPWIETFVWRE